MAWLLYVGISTSERLSWIVAASLNWGESKPPDLFATIFEPLVLEAWSICELGLKLGHCSSIVVVLIAVVIHDLSVYGGSFPIVLLYLRLIMVEEQR